MTDEVSRFDFSSPTDYRYDVKELVPFLSEEAFVKYKAAVESQLSRVQADAGLISEESAVAVDKACKDVSAKDVYDEEGRTRHDIIALRNVIRRHINAGADEAKSSVHRGATSYDIVETANAARYRDAFTKVIIPDMVALEREWIKQAKEYSGIVQIGRTHLQHAEPVTYGFALAWYVSRFGDRILRTQEAAGRLRGKFSGSVGAYNASSLLYDDPETFEADLMSEFDLLPAEISTQIVPIEPTLDLLHATISAFGVLANWTRDMRNLQRPEIAEVGQPRGSQDTSASSIMPHKVNPVGLENIESLWKATMPFIVTTYLDQISDHQRDLTNSASQRYLPQIFMQFDYSVRRAARVAKNIKPHAHNMQENLRLSANKIVSEPLQTTLSFYGHPEAHGYVEKMVEESERTGKPLGELAFRDPSLKPYLDNFTEAQRRALVDPTGYIGLAPKIAGDVAARWEKRLKEAGL